MSSRIEKPFYLQPPWNILFELHKLHRVKPWNVSISFLLMSFLEEMEKRGEINFKASGIALDSSSTIYLMKSKLLLKLQEPPPPPKPPPDFMPPPLFLPIRYELTSTTIKNLLDALKEVLQSEKTPNLKLQLEPILPPPEVLPPVDLYLMEVEKEMDKLRQTLTQIAKEKSLITFSKLVYGLNKLEAIKTFIVLLFLAQRGEINLWQEEDSDEIYITITEDFLVER